MSKPPGQSQDSPDHRDLKQDHGHAKKFATLGSENPNTDNRGSRNSHQNEPSQRPDYVPHSARNHQSNPSSQQPKKSKNNINNFARQFAAGDSFTEQSEDHHQHCIYPKNSGRASQGGVDPERMDSVQEIEMQKRQFLQEFQLISQDSGTYDETLILSS